jgi:hypothetical protein
LWRKILLCIAIIFSLGASPVSAGVSTNVTITAIPSWGILTFTATVISDTQVDLVWTYDANVSNVVIRAKYGSEPIDETDGYLVYSGVGNSISDTSMNFDENVGILYYKAFGETAPGVYGSSASDNAEGTVMLLLTLMGAALILTVSGYISKRSILAVMGGLFWIIVGVYAYTLSSQDWNAWDIYLALAFGCLLFSLVGVLAPVVTREKTETIEDTMMPESEFMRFNRDMQEMNMQLHVMTGGNPQPVARESNDIGAMQNYIERTRSKTLKNYRRNA